MSVTIIIPSYNQESYLSDAIESALAQTYPCEVIVIDDGSTDKSLSIARNFPTVKVISQVNKGLSSARNTGIMNSSSDWILPLDADDILLENCVENLVKVAEETGSDIVAPSFRAFGVSNGEVILMPNPKIEDYETGNRTPYFCLFKRSKLLEIGGYSPRMTWGYEDLHLTINLLSTGASLTTISDVLVLYRTKQESMITTAQKHHDELVQQINKDFPEAKTFCRHTNT